MGQTERAELATEEYWVSLILLSESRAHTALQAYSHVLEGFVVAKKNAQFGKW